MFLHHFISSLLLNSIAMALSIMNRRKSINGIYIADNKVAYKTGNPANNVPPPITSHTSFPSHTGPTAFNAILRSLSVLRNRCNDPAPRSKPSKIAYPENTAPTTRNHNVG